MAKLLPSKSVVGASQNSIYDLLPRLPLLVCALFALAASAQQQKEPGEQVTPRAGPTVITVTATPLPQETVPGDVTVISAGDIEGLAAHTGAEVLQFVRGMHVAQPHAFGRATLYQMGAEPNFTLVLLDGIPVNDVNDVFGGAFDVNAIDVFNLDRVEVVTGPLSAVYGSQAVAGVVNFITRRRDAGQPASADFELSGGSHYFRRAAVRGVAEVGGWDFSGRVSDQRVEEQVANDGQRLTSFSALAGRSWSRSRLDFTFHAADRADSGFPISSGGPRFSLSRIPETRDSRTVAGAADFAQQIGGITTLSLGTRVSSSVETFDTPAILAVPPPAPPAQPSLNGASDYTRVQPYGRLTFQLPASASVVVSFMPVIENGVRHSLVARVLPDSYQLQRSSTLTTAEAILQRARFTLNVGVGIHTGAGADGAEPRLGASVSLPAGWRIRASFATGFKLPSFFALGDKLVGNAALRPERAKSADFGMEWKGKEGTAIAFGYTHSRYTDLVDFSATEFRLVNRHNVHVHAAYLDVRQAIGKRTHIVANAAYASPKILDSTEPLRNRPKWLLTISGHSAVHSLVFAAAATYVSRRSDFQIPVPNIDSAPSYWNVRLSTTMPFGERLSAFLKIDNLLNSTYEEFIGFPHPGTTGEVGLRWRLVRKQGTGP